MSDPDSGPPSATDASLTRRELIVGAAGAIGGAVLAGIPAIAAAEDQAQRATPVAAPPATAPLPPGVRGLGTPTSAVGSRAAAVAPARTPVGEVTGVSFAPLHELTGSVTPADLHFERHHAGVPTIDASEHTLLVHGLVDHPLEFTLADLKRFPQVTRMHFVECSGNGRGPFREPNPATTAQRVAGMVSNSEWTGVPVRHLLDEVGVRSSARWVLAEGADACLLCRSIPIEKLRGDALIAWAQNGEPIRPEQGYPMRLLLPGWEGNSNVKWLRRLEFGTQPWMTRWETSKYTDPLADGTARQFSFDMDAKSVITSPTFPSVVTKGWWQVSGLAWSGRGRITKVEVSTSNGARWSDAELQGPSLPRAQVRFTHGFEWDGRETVLLSRATDETGYVQPTRAELIRARGAGTDYHLNPIYGWKIAADGHVTFHGET